MIGTFTSIDNNTYTVKIGGDTTPITLSSDPVHIKWDSADHIFVPMRSVTAEIRVLSETPLTELYTSDPLGCPVVIKKNTSTIFVGFLTPCEWKSPADNVLKDIELVAVDALTALKNVPFTRAESTTKMRAPSSFVIRAVSLINNALSRSNLTERIYFSGTLPWNGAGINEQAFLSDYHDDGVFEHKMWTDVLEAIAQFEGLQLMMYNLQVRFVDVSTIKNNSVYTIDDSKLTGASMSIVPAYSAVKVSYETGKQNYVVDINEDRMSGDVVEKTVHNVVSGVDDSNPTTTYYMQSKDWEPTDSRSVCGAMFRKYDNPLDDEDSYCVVGPCHLKQSAQRIIAAECAIGDDYDGVTRHIHVSVKGTRFGNESKQNGYYVLPIFSAKCPGSSPSGDVHVYLDQRKVADCYGLSADTIGIQSVDEAVIDDVGPLAGGTDIVFENGRPWDLIDIVVDDKVLITGVTITIDTIVNGKDMKKDSGGTITLSMSFKNELEISPELRPTYNHHAVTDVACKHTTAKTGDFDKYPYCDTNQFASPRPCYNITLQEIASMSITKPYKITSSDTNMYLADAADFDLLNNKATLSLIQTCYTI